VYRFVRTPEMRCESTECWRLSSNEQGALVVSLGVRPSHCDSVGESEMMPLDIPSGWIVLPFRFY
jgi:hypothetical protein